MDASTDSPCHLDSNSTCSALSFQFCVLCQKHKQRLELVTARSADTLLPYLSTSHQAQVRNYLKDGEHQLVYHRNCYYSRRRDTLVNETNTAEDLTIQPSPKKTRADVLPFDSSLCVFCQQVSCGKDRKLLSFRTGNAQATVESRLFSHPSRELQIRLQGIDLRAADAQYHQLCSTRFRNATRDSGTATVSTENDPIETLMANIRPYLKDGKAFYLHELVEELESLTGINRRADSVKRSLLSKYQSELAICSTGSFNNSKTVVFSSGISLHSIINEAFQRSKADSQHAQTHTQSNNTSDMDCIQKSALILGNDIKILSKSITKFDEISIETARAVVPVSLLQFLENLTSITDTSANSQKILSVAQDIVSMTSRHLTPKQISLAMTVKHLTGCKQLIQCLNSLGHTCSYTELQRMETTAAAEEIDKAKEIGIIIPSNLSRGKFTQMAMDNDDFLEETIDGKKTTHATTMVLYQTVDPNMETTSCNLPVAHNPKSRATSLKEDQLGDLLKLRPYVKFTERPSPPTLEAAVKLVSHSESDTALLSMAQHRDRMWILSRLHSSHLYEEINVQAMPSWSSFNTRFTASNIPRSVIGYCPMLDFKSSDPATIYTTLKLLNDMMGKLGQQHSVITFDWAIYHVAKQVQWDRPMEFSNTIIRMGGFHIILNYLATIGKMHESSGLREILVESGVYSEVTANQILSGKQYNRAVRGHKIIYEALYRMLLHAFQDHALADGEADPLIEVEDLDPEDGDYISQLASLEETISPKLHSFIQSMNEKSEVFHFWYTYIQAVEVLLAFIRADREGLWELHLASTAAMLPLFHAYDRQNYAKWLPVYLADMIALETTAPAVYDHFKRGEFVVNRTGNKFAGMPTDQVLEQTLNKDSKTAGGLIGFSNNDLARTKWFLTSHIRSQMLSTVKDMCDHGQLHSNTPHRHHEDRANLTQYEERCVRSVIKCMTQFNINPLDGSQPKLINIATGISPSPAIALKILHAPELGLTHATQFITDRLLNKVKPFYDPVPKLQIPGFSTLSAKAGRTKKASKSSGPKQSIARFMIMAANRDLDLKQILLYETGSIPLALFNEDGSLRKTEKAQLMHVLESYSSGSVQITEDPDHKAMIIDGMCFVQVVKGKPNSTFGEYSEIMLQAILKEGEQCNRIDVVYDVYSHSSIKSAERERRGETKMCNYKISHDAVRIPKNWQAFLSNIDNKNELVNYFIHKWQTMLNKIPAQKELYLCTTSVLRLTSESVENVHELDSNHDEADTKLVLHAKHAFERRETVFIRTVDTDVLVIALHHLHVALLKSADQNLILIMGMGKHKRSVSANAILANLPVSLKSSLLPLHALTGCDTVSSIARVTKQKAVKTVVNHQIDLSQIGQSLQVSESVVSTVERMMTLFYGHYTDITDARYHLLATKEITEYQLPPSLNAIKYHAIRANYQAWLWNQATTAQVDAPPPSDHGWNQQLKPHTHDPCPPNAKLVACACKTGCKSNTCKCRKIQLPCTDACVCKLVRECENTMAHASEETDSEAEDLL